jgi:hypothetical protein
VVVWSGHDVTFLMRRDYDAVKEKVGGLRAYHALMTSCFTALSDTSMGSC